MTLILQEVVTVESQDTSLVRLGYICKHNIHHTCMVKGREGEEEGREGGRKRWREGEKDKGRRRGTEEGSKVDVYIQKALY